MKIVIDAANVLSTSTKGGIAYFLFDLLSALSEVDKENEYIIFGLFWRDYKKKISEIKTPSASNLTLRTKRLPNAVSNLIENKLKISVIGWLLAKEKANLYHTISGGKLPLLKKMKNIISIYDLSFEVHPDWYLDKWYWGVKNSANRADCIITHSNYSAEEIEKLYRIKREKIVVFPLGVNTSLFKIISRTKDEINHFRMEFQIPEKYILTIITSSFERKNTINLLRAYKIVQQGEPDLKLVAVLGSHSLREEFIEILKSYELEDMVCFYTEIQREVLPMFYNEAELFLFPSRYEGFGLPVLEAMACGTPVITSNVTSLPEVAGDAGYLVNPEDAEEIASAVKEVLKNTALRQRMIDEGAGRVKSFAWTKSASALVSVYKKLAD